MPEYGSIEMLVARAQEEKKNIGQIVAQCEAAEKECGIEAIYQRMRQRLEVMRQSIERGVQQGNRTESGMTDDPGYRMKQGILQGKAEDDLLNRAVMMALSCAGHNACMGKIVAAPTAGACGILPAVLFSAQQEYGYPDTDLVESLFTAGAFAMAVSIHATLCGSSGGCMAECGVAGGMAAAALCQLKGGSPKQVADAFSIAVKSSLGLVCDPIAGQVEVPCIKRNGCFAAVAIAACNMACCGIESFVPADEVIEAMARCAKPLKKEKEKAPHCVGVAGTVTGQRMLHLLYPDGDIC